jgi:hypothetical protein
MYSYEDDTLLVCRECMHPEMMPSADGSTCEFKFDHCEVSKFDQPQELD